MEPVDRDNIFGSHEIAYECLADEQRTANFATAIADVVATGQQVIELGTGTGILSLLAAGAGARRVVACELSRPMAAMARRNVDANGLADVVEVFEADVTSVPGEALGGPFDVLIAEMVSIGLIEEQLVPAFNHVMAAGVLARGARCIPSGQRTWVELGDWDFAWHGFELPMIQVEQTWQPSKRRSLLTEATVVNVVDFEQAAARGIPVPEDVDEQLIITAVSSGVVNAVRVGGESVLTPTVTSGWTQCMNSPAVVPVEARRVRAGEELHVRVAYRMGGEFSTFRFDWT